MNRCPACDTEVFDAHECTERWEDESLGTKGWETTLCTVINGVMSVSVKGGTDMSDVPVMGLGAAAVEDWFRGSDG